jgi:hypothetical protein
MPKHASPMKRRHSKVILYHDSSLLGTFGFQETANSLCLTILGSFRELLGHDQGLFL